MVLLTRQRAMRNAQQLIDLPLDLLLEVFLLLEPLDLLHLTRTTKALREFLLNRGESSSLWNNAIRNVKDMPPCQDYYMSAPAYTHLAFVPVCHGCWCPCQTVDWALRMRCCPACFPILTKPESKICGTRYTYLDGVNFPKASRHYWLNYDSHSSVFVATTIFRYPYVSMSDWKVAIHRKQSHNVSIAEFLDKQNDFWGPIRKHARLCQKWELESLQREAARLSFVRMQRIEKIKDKLKELGWTDIVSSIYDLGFLRLPQVRKLEPLTPAEWVKICPQLINWAQKAKKNMIWNQCFTTFTSASVSVQQDLSSNASLKVQPRRIDIAKLPAVYPVLERSVNSESSDEDLKKKLFRVLPPAIRKWGSDAVEELEQFSREQLDLPPLSKPSCLPSVIFRCKECSRRHQRFGFDEALSHTHLYEGRFEDDKRENADEISSKDKFIMRFSTYPRNIQVLQVDVTVSRRVENLVRRMGRNPDRVTFDELRRSTVKVVCGLCVPRIASKMGFEQAFQHCLGSHLQGGKTEVWTRVSAREENGVISSHVKSSKGQ